MRIMFAVPSYWPSQDGVASITRYLAEGLAKRGHEVLAFTSAGNDGLQELPEKESHEDVVIERMRVYVRWPLKLKGRDDSSTREQYYKRVCEFKPDVFIIVCSQTWTLDWMIPYLDKIQCIKVFYSHGYSRLAEHNLILEKLKCRNILGAYEEYLIEKYYMNLHKILEKFDLAIYLSELNNAYLYSQKYRLSNGRILENAIEDVFLEDYMKHQKEHFFRPEIQFLYVANYNANKNQDMLLEAFCEADIENASLQLVGFEENSYLDMLREHLKEWMPAEDTKKVTFNVHLTREQVYDLYRTSDIFISTSKSENCPIVHCEAAATGMAVISTNVGDVRLKEGIILADSKEEIKEAIEHLYRNREELSERGQKLRKYMLQQKCRVEDKVEWLETELEHLIKRKENEHN